MRNRTASVVVLPFIPIVSNSHIPMFSVSLQRQPPRFCRRGVLLVLSVPKVGPSSPTSHFTCTQYRHKKHHPRPFVFSDLLLSLPHSEPAKAIAANNSSMGVEKEILTPAPAGAQRPQKGQKVTVHCTGYGKNRDMSQKFWSTKDPGQVPFSYNIGKGDVIKGWDEGVMDMGVGERAKLTCTPDYAYGEGGFPSWGIMPDSTLCFEIEVLSIE